MHYYQFNIGDYAAHTKGLSLLEDLAYRRLLDEYYLAERPFNGCSTDVARMIGMSEYLNEVEYILGKYFSRDGEFWRHIKIDKAIIEYKDKQDKAQKAGKASANARKSSKSNGRSTDVQPTINQEPRTNNQEPNIIGNLPATVENKQLAKARSPKGSRLSKDWVLPKDWGNWALEKGLPRDKVILEAEKFRNYWTSKSGSGATKVDWMATWHNWILKACEDFGSENKTFAERTQDFKNKQAGEFYAAGIGSASEETLRKLRLIP